MLTNPYNYFEITRCYQNASNVLSMLLNLNIWSLGHIVIHVLSLMPTIIIRKCRDRLKKFVIIVDQDRINNVPMIKSEES
jgi:hypothetical protein